MKMFVGLSLGEELANQVRTWRNKHKHLPVRWLDDKDLHITLIPPWDEQDVSYNKKIFSQVSPPRALNLQFHTVELGPTAERENTMRQGQYVHNPKRLIWVVGETTPELLEFKYNVESIFDKPHDPRFLLHITLARLNSQTPVSFVSEQVEWKGQANTTVLYESLGGSRYTKLANI